MNFKKFLVILVLSFFTVSNNAFAYHYNYNLDDDDDQASSNYCPNAYDPYEKINRKIFMFNSVLDYFLLRPVAIFYRDVTNDYIKARVGSFTENINVPLTTVNYTLQKDPENVLRSFWRFMINTTFGIGGLFDVASKMGLTVTPQTFGSTLAHYGVGPGPYLVIPFFGGTNGRDFTDSLFTNTYLNPLKYPLHSDFKLGLTATKLVHDRMVLLPFTDYVTQNSTDAYVSIRSSIHQNRESVVQYPENFKCPKYKTKR